MPFRPSVRRFAAVLATLLLPATASADIGLVDRMACATALEAARWEQRLWPESNHQPKPAAAQVLDTQAIRAGIDDMERMEAALAAEYGVHIDAPALQAELDRLVTTTRDPAQLRLLFAALDHDPARIGECLARPLLVQRRLHQAYTHDAGRRAALRDAAKANATPSSDVVHTLVIAPATATGETRALDAATWADEHARLRQGPQLQDSDEGIVLDELVSADATRLQVRTRVWRDVPFQAWWRTTRDRHAAKAAAIDTSTLRLAAIRGDVGTDAGQWRSEAMPEGRHDHHAVWTGSEMLLWGGSNPHGSVRQGARYVPATDTWLPMAIAPAPTAAGVWTGTHLLAWDGTAAGASYDPATDAWTAMSVAGAPEARRSHSLVWTGSELIVWGGSQVADPYGTLADGGRYDPASDSWTAMPVAAGVPYRSGHGAVWTGDAMVLVGGETNIGIGPPEPLSASRFDPVDGSWSTLSNLDAPINGYYQAVWTGDELLVWDGSRGARYDATDARWHPFTDIDAPDNTASTRAVWTGTHLLVWGSHSDGSNWGLAGAGGRYDPATDTWQAITPVDAPRGRSMHSAVWTGSELVVWGGLSEVCCRSNGPWPLDDGGRYDPATDRWVATSRGTAPLARSEHSAVWTGMEMIVWGGRGSGNGHLGDGTRYEPATDQWTALATLDAPTPRSEHVALWTGSRMLVWGGENASTWPALGGSYDPVADAWTSVPAHDMGWGLASAAWSGDEMLVWQGGGGARYAPASGEWSDMATTALAGSGPALLAWSGDALLVVSESCCGAPVGARYTPTTDSWQAMAMANAPSGRGDLQPVWTGDRMLFWGGGIVAFGGFLQARGDGGLYDPVADAWQPVATLDAPIARTGHTLVWTGEQLLTWGGWGGVQNQRYLDDGAAYDPATDQWTALPLAGRPTARYDHTAVWTGTSMIVFGGWRTMRSLGVYTPAGEDTQVFADGFEPSTAH